jgi:hypothetical protein
MPTFVPEVIVWTCVVAFVLCMAGGLLTVFGFWEPKDPKVRKWLLNGVVISVVGGVAGYGVRIFSAPPAPPPTANAAAQTNAPPAVAPSAPPGHADGRPPSPVPAAAAAANGIPEQVREWATRALGERPVLSPTAAADYPACVARLGGQDVAAVSQADVRSCRSDLERFHAEVIVAYYNRKAPYDGALQAQEAELRENGAGPGDAKYDYVRSEMTRLNGDDSAEWDALMSLEERWGRDSRSCARARCHS